MSRLSGKVSRFLAAAPAAFLTAEFAIFDLAFYAGKPFGQDARVYLAATQAWLSGGDPWEADWAGIRFAGIPPTLLPFAPLAWLGEGVVVALITVASVVSAVFIVRRLELPLWWLLFPPLIEAISAGSVNLIVLALALTRLHWLAAVTKPYVALPALLLAHVRQLAIAAVFVAVTFPFLPWQAFFAHDLPNVLSAQSWGGPSAWMARLFLIPIGLVALILIDRKRGAWFSVPVLWPGTQFNYSMFALPARPSALAGAILAVPYPGAP